MDESSPPTAHILRRTDRHLLPFLALLFLLNSVDRSNIGNAETAGFTKHAGLKPSDLNDAVALFFVAFVALQPVGAALGKRVGVGRWVGGVMIGWGLLTMLTAFVRSRAQLLTLRVCIGALEAGFYPATVFYLSLFYTRYEFAQRLGMFYGQYAVAGAFGGLVSYIVFSLFPSDQDEGPGQQHQEDTTKTGGWHSYQILFVLEGVLTIVVAVATLLWLPTGPGTAWWLTPAERAFAQQRVLADRFSSDPARKIDADADREADGDDAGAGASADDDDGDDDDDDDDPASSLRRRASNPLLTPRLNNHSPNHGHKNIAVGGEAGLSRADVFLAMTDSKIWALLALNILSAVPATAFSIFLPLVLAGLGHSPLAANALTIPPFLLGAATLWTVTWQSDRARVRIPYVLLGLAINAAGLLLALLLPESWTTARYVGLCVLLAGSFIASPLTVAWLTNNVRAPGKRAVALGINGWGNLAGVVAGKLFDPAYAPTYHVPLAVTLAAVVVSALGYVAFMNWLKYENRLGPRRTAAIGPWRRWAWKKFAGGGKAAAGELRDEVGGWGL